MHHLRRETYSEAHIGRSSGSRFQCIGPHSSERTVTIRERREDLGIVKKREQLIKNRNI